MDLIANIGVMVSFLVGFIYLILSMFVLHTYETKKGARPTTLQLWPFSEELKEAYPEVSKIGRYLFTIAILAVLPWFLKSIAT